MPRKGEGSGTTAAHPIPDAALDADIAILGKKGRGKTYAAKGVVERLLDLGRRVLVLDPLSVWWGLRSAADGAGPGYPVAVFGGPHGDLPLTEAMGRPLARIVAETNLPAVLDMGEMRKAAWQRLVRDLLDELFARNREPLWVVLEEADVFAPQQPREGDSAAVLGEVDRIARRGRAYGFRLISITQRPARLHKDVLTQLSTLVALGLTSPQDRDAIKAWVEGNADRDQARAVMDSLASLPVGEGWVWAPDHRLLERVRFPAIRTLDTSATPMAGERRAAPARLAEVDLAEVRAALAKVASDAPRARGETQPSAEALRAAEARGYERGLVDGAAMGRLDERQRIRHGVEALLRGTEPDDPSPFASRRADLDALSARNLGGLLIGVPDASAAPARAPGRARARAPGATRALAEPTRRDRPPVEGGTASEAGRRVRTARDGLSPSARKILDVVLAVHPRALSYPTAAARAGVSKKSSTYRRYRQELIDAGLVEERDHVLHAVGEALRLAPVAPPTLEGWYGRLVPSEASMLRALADADAALSRDELAERSGISRTSSGLGAAIRQLVSLGLAQTEGAKVRIAPGLVD